MTFRPLLAAATLAIVLPASAQAAADPVRGTGARVTWPAALRDPAPTVAAGTRLTLRVAQPRRSARTLVAQLRQRSPAARTLGRTALRRGTVRFVVPTDAHAARFVLELRAGGRVVRRSTFVTSPPPPLPAPPSSAPPASTPPAAPGVPNPCTVDAAPAATIGEPRRSPSPFAGGGVLLSFPVANTGTGCLWDARTAALQRLDGETWVDVVSPPIATTGDLRFGPSPGGSMAVLATLAADAPAGRYRVVIGIYAMVGWSRGTGGPQVREFDHAGPAA